MWTYGEPSIRSLWDFEPDIAFLNHGSYGAVPIPVLEAYFNIQKKIEKNPVEFLSRKLPGLLSEVRCHVAQWLNAESQGLAFVSNATAGVGSVLASLPLEAGDEIVFHDHGYGWVRQGLHNLVRSQGVVVREAEIPLFPSSNQQIVFAFERVISGKTKLLICDHVTSPTALVFPVTEIVEMAHRQGVPVLVDGAHAPGLLPLNLASIGADFYTGNFHKWVCAPRGAAFLSVAPQWRDFIRPQSVSYMDGVTHHKFDQSFTGYFDWTGTQQFANWLAVSAALDFHAASDWTRIFSERRRLLDKSCQLFSAAFGCAESEFAAHEFRAAMAILPWQTKEDVVLSAVLARELTRELYEQSRVEIPVIFFKDRLFLRISTQIYNSEDDVRRLIEAVGAHRCSAVRIGDR